MPANPAIDELQQRCLDAIRCNRAMLSKLASNPTIGDRVKLEMTGRLLDSSSDLAELLDLIDQQSKSS
jgi:hypothetical protein